MLEDLLGGARAPPPVSKLSDTERREAWRIQLRDALHDGNADLVLDLLEQHPKLAGADVDNGRLPLHLALDRVGQRIGTRRDKAEKAEASSSSLHVNDGEEEEGDEEEEEEEDEYGEASRAVGVVAELCALYPAAAMEPDKKHGGALPLHIVLEQPRPEPLVVFELLRRYRSAAGQPSLDGHLPLFMALGRGEEASETIVQELIRAHPDALTELSKDDKDMLPLHLSIANGCPDAVVHLVLRHDVTAAAEKDAFGLLPLHHALIADGGPSLETIAMLIDAYRPALEESIPWLGEGTRPGVTSDPAELLLVPAQYAAAMAPPAPAPAASAASAGRRTSIVSSAYAPAPSPEASKQQQHSGPLSGVLQVAASCECSLDVLRALLRARPEGIEERDGTGRLPLHCALEAKAPDEIIELFIDAWTEGVGEASPRGPCLHRALACGASEPICSRLLGMHAEAVWLTDVDGRLPLAVALASNAPKSIAWRLLLLNPDAAAKKDESGTLGASAGVASNASADLQAATVRFSSAFTTTPDEIVMRPPEGERREMVPDFDPYADIEAHVKRVAKHKYRGWNP